MASSKRRKVHYENRLLKKEWVNRYAFILPTGSSNSHCLVCSQKIALVKSINLKRHYKSTHNEFERIYKQGLEEQKQKIKQLKFQHEMSTMILANMTRARVLSKNSLDFREAQKTFQ